MSVHVPSRLQVQRPGWGIGLVAHRLPIHDGKLPSCFRVPGRYPVGQYVVSASCGIEIVVIEDQLKALGQLQPEAFQIPPRANRVQPCRPSRARQVVEVRKDAGSIDHSLSVAYARRRASGRARATLMLRTICERLPGLAAHSCFRRSAGAQGDRRSLPVPLIARSALPIGRCCRSVGKLSGFCVDEQLPFLERVPSGRLVERLSRGCCAEQAGARPSVLGPAQNIAE